MRKLLIALSILTSGGLLFAHLHRQSAQATAMQAECQTQGRLLTNRLSELTTIASALRARIHDQRANLQHLSEKVAVDLQLLALLGKSQSEAGSRPVSPELRQRLGIAWDDSPDYILVSKAALRSIWLPGVDEHGKVSSTLADLLALTPDECTAVKATCERAEADYAAWFKTAVERIEPSGEIIAEYRVPANPQLAERLQQEAETALAGELGPERPEFLKEFAGVWLDSHSELGRVGTRFTVHRTPGRQPPLWFQTEDTNGSSGAADVNRYSFPGLFRNVFPGGWPELAQRGGFELPADY